MSNNLYIPLEEAIKVIKNWESITSNCDTIQESFDALADAIEIIPTIDPIATIDEMIEENVNTLNFGKTNILQKLKSKLSPNQ